jgi:glycerol-3-phosphate dehydrogenase
MNGALKKLTTQVLIIGGGITGTGLARDLALRGVPCLVVEKDHLNAGASGANHGLLHSGARYVSNDSLTAQECRSESQLIKQLAPHCCEDTGGLFVAVAGDNERFVADFPRLCERNGIAVQAVDAPEARDLEPELSRNVIAAYGVEDATVDPFRLSCDNMSDALAHGAGLLTHTRVVEMARRGRRRILSVKFLQVRSGTEMEVEAELIANVSGAWVGQVAELAGLQLPLVWSKGSILITQQRLTDRVINRLRPPADGDIVVPGGTVSLLGTTSLRIDSIEELRAECSEVDSLVAETAKLVPTIHSTRLIRAFAGVRPLMSRSTGGDDRQISRGSEIIDHEKDGIANLITVIGGKLTTFRLTAEKAADLVCQKLGLTVPCLTGELPLPTTPVNEWVVANLAPGTWRRHRRRDEALLCECEMVPMSAIAQIVDQLQTLGETVDLDAIRLNSRLGKGSCQGAFCSLRTTGFLYDRGILREDHGIRDLRNFLEARWKGLRPVLWGRQLVQEQLQEAVHCGLLGLETYETKDSTAP